MINKRRAVRTGVDASDAMSDRSQDSPRDSSSDQPVEVEVDRQMPSLPEEVLVEIWSCVRYDELWGSYNMKGIPFMFIASWVSGRWREITIRLSSLWRDIHISPKVSPRLVKLQLERSRIYVLDITAAPHLLSPYYSDGNGQLVQTRLQENWNAALGHISRWRSFEFIACADNRRCHASYAKTLLPSLLDAHAPSLQRLSIQHSGGGLGFSLFGGGAPVLFYIELGWVSFSPTMALMDLSPLTSLTLRSIPARKLQSHEEFRNMLDKCPSLTDLTIDGVVTNGSLDEIYPIIRVPSLRSLTITLTEAYFVTYFFQHFSAPRLHSLKLSIECVHAFRAFVDTMSITGPSLKFLLLSKLCLDGFPIDESVDPGLFQFFESLASVDYLEFQNESHRVFLGFLTEKQDRIDEVPLLPRLRTVQYWPYSGSDEGQSLRGFISRRIALGVPIAKLRTRHDEFTLFYSASEQEWIRKHVEVLYV